MAEAMEEGPSRVSQAGLVLFHAFNKMGLAQEPRRGSRVGNTGKAHRIRKAVVPTLLDVDIPELEEDAFDEVDTTNGISTDDKEGTWESPELVSDLVCLS